MDKFRSVVIAALLCRTAVSIAKYYDNHLKKKKTESVDKLLQLEKQEIEANKKFEKEYTQLHKQEMESRKKFHDELMQLLNKEEIESRQKLAVILALADGL